MGCKATSTVPLIVVGGDTRHIVDQEVGDVGRCWRSHEIMRRSEGPKPPLILGGDTLNGPF